MAEALKNFMIANRLNGEVQSTIRNRSSPAPAGRPPLVALSPAPPQHGPPRPTSPPDSPGARLTPSLIVNSTNRPWRRPGGSLTVASQSAVSLPRVCNTTSRDSSAVKPLRMLCATVCHRSAQRSLLTNSTARMSKGHHPLPGQASYAQLWHNRAKRRQDKPKAGPTR